LEALIGTAQQLAVSAAHGKELHAEAIGQLGTHDDGGPEVLSAEFDAQPENGSNLDLVRGLYGKTKGAEVDQGGSETPASSGKAHAKGGLGLNPCCSPAECHFVPRSILLLSVNRAACSIGAGLDL
jgi:hypothetical protein